MGIDHREGVVIGELMREQSAEPGRIIDVQHGDEDVAVDIVIAERLGLEDAMRINQARFLSSNPIGLGEPVRLIDIEEHDPSGRREEELDFGKRAAEEGRQVVGSQRFIVKHEHPPDHKQRDEGIPSPEHACII